MAIQVPCRVDFAGSSSMCIEPSIDAPVLRMACNIMLPLAALVDALAEFQRQSEALASLPPPANVSQNYWETLMERDAMAASAESAAACPPAPPPAPPPLPDFQGMPDNDHVAQYHVSSYYYRDLLRVKLKEDKMKEEK